MKMAFRVGILCGLCCAACVAKPFKVTVRVLDEDGTPIAGKNVTCSITEALSPGFGWGGGKEVKKSGTTDIHGVCELCHGSQDGFAAIGILSDEVHYGHSHWVEIHGIVTVALVAMESQRGDYPVGKKESDSVVRPLHQDGVSRGG